MRQRSASREQAIFCPAEQRAVREHLRHSDDGRFLRLASRKVRAGLIIECKYQETGGSADEKFPYTVLSLKKTGVPAILLLIGAGAKRKAVDWCIRQQSTALTVFTSVEAFLRRANGGLL